MPDLRTGTALLDTARAFRPRIIAQRERIEASRRPPEDLTRELAAAGLLRPTFTFTDPHFLPEPRYRIPLFPRDSRPRGRSR